MKKVLVLCILIAMGSVALCGCSDADNQSNDQSGTQAEVKWKDTGPKDETIGVFMELEDITPTGLTAHLKIYEKKDDVELLYGEMYWIEKYDGETWVDPLNNKDRTINSIAYSFNANGDSYFKVDWEWLYGKLSPGTYRFIKDVDDLKHRDANDRYNRPLTYYLVTEFTIEN